MAESIQGVLVGGANLPEPVVAEFALHNGGRLTNQCALVESFPYEPQSFQFPIYGMSTKNTYLFPETPDVVVPEDKLVEHLWTIGFIGERNERAVEWFWRGPRFMELMGVASEPKDHFSPRSGIHVVTETDVQLIVSAEVQHVRPACRCGASLENWADAFSVTPWAKDAIKPTVTCPKCRRENHLWEWIWDHRAGFARQYIEVLDFLWKGPTAELLESLGGLTHTPWTWARYHM